MHYMYMKIKGYNIKKSKLHLHIQHLLKKLNTNQYDLPKINKS